jgi:hypothetical protein
LDFTLPDANSLDAMVYYEPSQPELYHGRNLDPAYHRFAHRSRIELVHAYDEVAVRASQGRSTARLHAPPDTTVPAKAWETGSCPALLRARVGTTKPAPGSSRIRG